jgi:hypothetical protein
MSFLFLILLFLVMLVIVPLFVVGSSIYRAYHKIRGNRASDDEAHADYASRNPFRRGHRHNQARQRKVFSADEGEYVRFEEVEVDTAEEQERRRRYDEASYPTEEQVSDADWQDL